MTNRDLHHLLSGKHRHHPDFTIVPEFKDIIHAIDEIDCVQACQAINILERNAEAFLAHVVRTIVCNPWPVPEYLREEETT